MNRESPQRRTQITRYEALAAADARGTICAPAGLLVESSKGGFARLLGIGTPAELRHHPAWSAARAIALPSAVLLPGLVNAHAHLDLTHLGPRPYEPASGFMGWVEMIRSGRCTSEADVAASVQRGVELSLAGGTVAIGDIAGAMGGRPCLAAAQALRESPLLGVSFVEFFGIGNRLAASLAHLDRLVAQLLSHQELERARPLRIGLQPHAPNTVDLRLYLAAAAAAERHGLALSTHLAETMDEREFIGVGTGPQRRLLESLGIWDDSVLEGVGRGVRPVQHLAAALEASRFLVAHVNDCDARAIEILARTRASVAYCPRASAYFGAERVFGPHRYRDMLEAGINVCLGTDSVVNLPTSAADPGGGGISVLDEARFLFRRDGTDARRLIAMATTHGAIALGLDPTHFQLQAGGQVAGLIAVDAGEIGRGALEAVLGSDAPPRMLFHGCGPVGEREA